MAMLLKNASLKNYKSYNKNYYDVEIELNINMFDKIYNKENYREYTENTNKWTDKEIIYYNKILKLYKMTANGKCKILHIFKNIKCLFMIIL